LSTEGQKNINSNGCVIDDVTGVEVSRGAACPAVKLGQYTIFGGRDSAVVSSERRAHYQVSLDNYTDSLGPGQ